MGNQVTTTRPSGDNLFLIFNGDWPFFLWSSLHIRFHGYSHWVPSRGQGESAALGSVCVYKDMGPKYRQSLHNTSPSRVILNPNKPNQV